MDSGGYAAISAIMLGVVFTVVGMLVIRLFIQPAERREGSLDDDEPVYGAARPRGERDERAHSGLVRPSRVSAPGERTLPGRPATPAEARRGGRPPRRTLRLGLHHASMAVAVASMALLFGTAIGLVVRWLLGK